MLYSCFVKDGQKKVVSKRVLFAALGVVSILGVLLFFLTGAEATLILILPFGLAGAVSPVMLTTQTVILTTPKGKRAATHYALGATGVLAFFVAMLIVFGLAFELPKQPSLSSTLDIVIGVLFFALSAGVYLIRPKKKSRPKKSLSARGALGFGTFSMATNFTTLAIMIPAAKMISSHDHILFERGLLVIVLVLLASLPAWLPVALSAAAPGPADKLLGALDNFIQKRSRLIISLALASLGIYLFLKGALDLL